MPELIPSISIETLYSQHYGWLTRYLRHKLGDQDNAVDLAQDVFALLLASETHCSLREPRAYLTTLAKRLSAQYYRRLSIEQAYLGALAQQPDGASPSPEHRLLILEALNEVDRVLRTLPERVRHIFLLSQLDGLSYKDIAGQLDVTVNIVQKAMIKALQHCYQAVYG